MTDDTYTFITSDSLYAFMYEEVYNSKVKKEEEGLMWGLLTKEVNTEKEYYELWLADQDSLQETLEQDQLIHLERHSCLEQLDTPYVPEYVSYVDRISNLLSNHK